MFQFLETVAHLEPFVVDPGKVEVILQADHILGELTVAFLFIVAQVELLIELTFQVFEVKVNLEVFQKAAIPQFDGVGIGVVELGDAHLAFEKVDVGDCLDVAQDGGVK